MKRDCAIYARVSTTDQTCENQLRELRIYAEARGWTVVEYVDTGVSGAKESRPALDKLMTAARRREIGAVLVWKFDRFARSTKHLVLALEEFNSLGVQFISHQEAIDTSTPMGKAMFAIIAAMAELERNLIAERVKAGIARHQASGKRWARQRTDVDRGAVVRLREAGLSHRKIAQALGISNGLVYDVLKGAAA